VPLLGALATYDLVDFSVDAVLRAHGRRGSGLQHFGEGLQTRLDRGRIETRHLRTSPLGAAAPVAGPVPGPAPGRLVTWNSRFVLVDCLSTIVPRGSRWSRENRVLRNAGFMAEAKRLSDLSRLYEWPPAAERK